MNKKAIKDDVLNGVDESQQPYNQQVVRPEIKLQKINESLNKADSNVDWRRKMESNGYIESRKKEADEYYESKKERLMIC